MSYCTFVHQLDPSESHHRAYHDQQYGFPIKDDRELFGRLILEINQAGLSWLTILKKADAFRTAFHEYDIQKIARYKDKDLERLMNNPGIIRNRLKIQAVIYNAQVLQQLQDSHGSFYLWLCAHHPLEKEAWVKLFRKNFKFTGGEIVNSFLMSIGFLPGAHDPDCPVYKKILSKKPLWLHQQ
jgi:DNA-3-methyladenine glycosylase I